MHRRHFLAALAAVGLSGPRLAARTPAAPRLPLDPATLPRWLDPLPRLPVASPATGSGAVSRYRIAMRESTWRFHRHLAPSRVWTYGGTFPGPIIEARSGTPLQVEWSNELPAHHFLPIDYNLMGASRGTPEVRAVVHLHGGRVPHGSDGFPEDWRVPGQTQLCHYPNAQEAAMLWYHDHAMGINRLNVFAGLFGVYLLRDEDETSLRLPAGDRELVLTICDRQFDRAGGLFYPTSGLPFRPWIPEFFGNAIVLNGALWPYLEVGPRTYRWRILNASNARFLNLSVGEGLSFRQFGADQGRLRREVARTLLPLAPGERADLLIDFSAHAGATLYLKNDVVEVMQLRVGAGPPQPRLALPPRLRAPEPARPLARTRRITLTESVDAAGIATQMLFNGCRWHAPITETPLLDSTEIWELVNTTDDTHPVHLHMVRFEVLDRRGFDLDEFLVTGRLVYTAEAVVPEPGEDGWKDTVRAHGGMVTRIRIHFAGYSGRYAYHCHILEHEANEMMRPFDVLTPSAASAIPRVNHG